MPSPIPGWPCSTGSCCGGARGVGLVAGPARGRPAEHYELLVARVSTLVYGIDGDRVRRAAILRAQAMAFRDAREGAVTEADWLAITDQLVAAYRPLKQALLQRSGS